MWRTVIVTKGEKLTVTEKQYDSMKLLVGERLKAENLLDKRDIIEL